MKLGRVINKQEKDRVKTYESFTVFQFLAALDRIGFKSLCENHGLMEELLNIKKEVNKAEQDWVKANK